MKPLLHSILLAMPILSSLVPAAAQAHTYEVVTADIHFKFTAGERTFSPGHYEFILAGPGVMAVRDQHKHVVASLVTRTTEAARPSPSTRLEFDRKKKTARLEKFYLEQRTQVLEVLGEQLAIHSVPPATSLPAGVLSFSQRSDGIRLKQ